MYSLLQRFHHVTPHQHTEGRYLCCLIVGIYNRCLISGAKAPDTVSDVQRATGGT